MPWKFGQMAVTILFIDGIQKKKANKKAIKNSSFFKKRKKNISNPI